MVILGANIARQALEAGLLDEIIVHIAPVLVGDGVRLFQSAGGAPIKLQAISSHMEGETTVLRYAGPSDATGTTRRQACRAIPSTTADLSNDPMNPR